MKQQFFKKTRLDRCVRYKYSKQVICKITFVEYISTDDSQKGAPSISKKISNNLLASGANLTLVSSGR